MKTTSTCPPLARLFDLTPYFRRASTTALSGGILMALSSVPNTAMAAPICTAIAPAPTGYALGYSCTGMRSSRTFANADTYVIVPGAGDSITAGIGMPALTFTANNGYLNIGNGAVVQTRSISPPNNAAVLLDESSGTQIVVRNGGLITSDDPSFAAGGIEVRDSLNVKITVEDGGVVETQGGFVILGDAVAPGVTVHNSGRLENSGTAARSVIQLEKATITNEKTGVIRSGSEILQTVALNDGGTLTNHGLIENTAGAFGAPAIVGDETKTTSETVINSGTIRIGDPTRTAINLKAGDDILELQPGSVIVGTVLGGDGDDTLRFGGSGAASFGLGEIGPGKQYREFEMIKVTNGEWSFTGSTTNDVTVENGTVKGNGTFGNLSFSGGTLAPGNSIGTINVTGNLVLGAGSTFEAEVNAAGESDLVAVTGTATITGAALSIKGEAGSYSATSPTYTILTAGGGVTGTFGTVTDDMPDLDFDVEYRSNDVRLTYTKTGALTSPKEVISAGIAGAGVADILFRTTLTDGRKGSSGTSQRLSFKNLPDDVSLSTKNFAGRNWTVWTAAVGQKVDVGASGGLIGWDASIGGAVIGIDAAPSLNMPLIASAALGYTNTRTTVGASTSQVGTTHVGLSASMQSGAWTFDGGLTYGKQKYDITRVIPVGAGSRTAKGSTTGRTIGVQLNSYYELSTVTNSATRSSLSYGPVIGLDWFQTKQAGYTETGAGVLNLNVASSTTTQAAARLGMSGSLSKQINGANVTFDGLLAFERNLGDRSVTTVATLPATGQQFTTLSAPIGLNRAVIGLGASIELGANTTAFATYEGRLDNVSSDHSAAIGISINF